MLYTLKAAEQLIDRYIDDYGGVAYTIEEGVLGLGTIILQADGKKSAVITEVYLNPWSSGHKIRFYNKPPKKYEQKILELY